MFERDILVACVAFGVGFCILYAVLFDQARCFQGPIGRRLSDRYGDNAGRILVGVSVFVIMLGFYILACAFFQRSNQANSVYDLDANSRTTLHSSGLSMAEQR